ncbi:alpha/beta hydrolase [Planotetraspora sp. A-T 1434]|uniref:alpha/beta fold hydrolase n=1 Tax=Planotetraspora sp. A-T 1434 TaxID=2979219 RepID=UPI0021C24484|nr:alpha/beta hydrolase [Planotetraspora sp. A-T 1434]MCT9933959.1 alpha/beta hydrolase [Planotetraspora sp. A-T 1434]
MPFADLGDARLFYTDDGSARPVLLLVHGWGSDSHEWSHHIPALRERYRVIAVDLRGHGYSSAAESGNTPRRMADDLVRLCGRLGVETVIPIGHSMGAQVVSHLAVEHPSLVRALVTVDPGYGFTGAVADGFPAMVAALREGDANATAVQMDQWTFTPASPGWLKEWHRRRLLAMPAHVLTESFAAMFGEPRSIGVRPASEEYLVRRECPVLSFWFDPAQAAWERTVFKDPRSKTVVWEGSGHRLHEERPGEFLLVVNTWVKEVTR